MKAAELSCRMQVLPCSDFKWQVPGDKVNGSPDFRSRTLASSIQKSHYATQLYHFFLPWDSFTDIESRCDQNLDLVYYPRNGLDSRDVKQTLELIAPQCPCAQCGGSPQHAPTELKL
jgi:hypothetical protein